MISVFVVLALLVCVQLFVSPPLNEANSVVLLTGMEIRNPEIALQYGVTGYLEIVYPSDSPDSLVVDRGGEIDMNILLHFVSYSPGVTEAQVTIDPTNPCGLWIEQGDVVFNELVSYNPSGNITIEAGETVPVIMTIRILEDFPSSIETIALGSMGISTDFPVISELGEKELTIH
jgi:hypothetical protein